MSIQVTCEHCAASYRVGDDFSGKRVKCSKCGEAVTVSTVRIVDDTEAPDVQWDMVALALGEDESPDTDTPEEPQDPWDAIAAQSALPAKDNKPPKKTIAFGGDPAKLGKTSEQPTDPSPKFVKRDGDQQETRTDEPAPPPPKPSRFIQREGKATTQAPVDAHAASEPPGYVSRDRDKPPVVGQQAGNSINRPPASARPAPMPFLSRESQQKALESNSPLLKYALFIGLPLVVIVVLFGIWKWPDTTDDVVDRGPSPKVAVVPEQKPVTPGTPGSPGSPQANDSTKTQATPAPGIVPTPVSNNPISSGWSGRPVSQWPDRFPLLPDLPPPKRVSGSVAIHEVQLTGTEPGQHMRLWIYLPSTTTESSLPCLLLAPMRQSYTIGQSLTAAEETSFLIPLAKTGIAVVAFDIAGHVVTSAELAGHKQHVKSFAQAYGGLLNMRNAMQYTATKIPDIDPKQIYATGMLASGGLAITYSAHDPRVAGVVALTPTCNYVDGPDTVNDLESSLPGLTKLITATSPTSHYGKYKAPILIVLPNPNTPTAQHTKQFHDTVSRSVETQWTVVSPEKQQTINTIRDWVNRPRQQIAQKDKPPTTAPALPGVPASLDEAVVDLDDTSRERRLAALRFINSLAVDDSKRDQVLSGCSIALTDKDHQVRALAVTVTKKWSSDKGYTEFVAAIEQTGPGPVFDDMCQRLLDLGTPRAIEYVAGHLSHSIVVSLMRSAGSKVEAAVVKQLTSVDVIVRRNAAKVLETIATEVSFDALKNALDDKDRTVAALAAQAIERLVPSKPKPPSIVELVEQLKSDDTTTHEAALQKLAAINDPQRKADVAPVLGKFLRHEELNLRRIALTAAQNWATKDHIGLLTPYVAKQDGDANDRHTAMKALAQTRHPAAVRPIVRWLIQDSAFVKTTLIEMGSVAEREVIRVATTANSTKAKIAACEILESIGTKRVEAPLRLLLKHRSPEVQSAAAKARQAIASRK